METERLVGQIQFRSEEQKQSGLKFLSMDFFMEKVFSY